VGGWSEPEDSAHQGVEMDIFKGVDLEPLAEGGAVGQEVAVHIPGGGLVWRGLWCRVVSGRCVRWRRGRGDPTTPQRRREGYPEP